MAREVLFVVGVGSKSVLALLASSAASPLPVSAPACIASYFFLCMLNFGASFWSWGACLW